jgi:hypothetical protein
MNIPVIEKRFKKSLERKFLNAPRASIRKFGRRGFGVMRSMEGMSGINGRREAGRAARVYWIIG